MDLHGGLVSVAMESRPLLDHYQTIQERVSLGDRGWPSCDAQRSAQGNSWQAIEDEAADLRLDETQKRQLSENLQKARHDLKESVWRSFKHVLLLGKDNTLRQVDWAWCILAQRALR